MALPRTRLRAQAEELRDAHRVSADQEDFWVRLQTPRPDFFAYLVAILETLVALAVILGFARKLTYIASAIFSVVIWAVAEGFGGPYMSGSSDIGTAVIYAVVFAGLLVIAYYAGTDRYSVDYYLEQRVSWWWKVAEMRRPAIATVPAPAPVERIAAGVASRPSQGEPV